MSFSPLRCIRLHVFPSLHTDLHDGTPGRDCVSKFIISSRVLASLVLTCSLVVFLSGHRSNTEAVSEMRFKYSGVITT